MWFRKRSTKLQTTVSNRTQAYSSARNPQVKDQHPSVAKPPSIGAIHVFEPFTSTRLPKAFRSGYWQMGNQYPGQNQLGRVERFRCSISRFRRATAVTADISCTADRPKAPEGALGSAFVRSEEQIADKKHKSGPRMRWGTINVDA